MSVGHADLHITEVIWLLVIMYLLVEEVEDAEESSFQGVALRSSYWA